MLRRVLGADHLYVSIGESILGECLGLRGQFERAERLLRRSYETLARARGDTDRLTTEALERVVRFYENAGKSDKVEVYRARLTNGHAP